MKMSLILPYWDRQEAANEALALLEQYAGLDLEVIVVDDGNEVPFIIPQSRLDIRCLRLPRKRTPKSPVTAWNEGVKASTGDIIVLSCVEILHTAPVLEQMKEALLAAGPDGYVLAAAWCPEEHRWHCHSTVKLPRNPWGTGQSYCSMMRRELYERAGGFGEEYRDGAGYEDNDFVNRLLAAGARFDIRDELVVTHPKRGATIRWPDGAFARNEEIFYRKWPGSPGRQVTFVCVNHGNYCGRGADYVNRLFHGVTRNLAVGTAFRFVCFCDDSGGLERGIDARPLPENLQGWWNKLYLFKEGLFAAGERVVYLDLDTVITGPLDEITGYGGEFATLRDFYHDRLGPGVMLWKGGFGADIWASYEAAGFPTDLPLGDLDWINRHFAERGLKADILQELFPGKFCSYKVHARHGIPEGTSVVCFHGLPRPHEAGGWVDSVWAEGKAEFESFVVPNVGAAAVAKNVQAACSLDLPWLAIRPEHTGEAVIVGGGPSLADLLDEVRMRKAAGQFVIATNGAHDFLTANGIIPDAALVIDARADNAAFLKNPQPGVKYHLASQCDPALFAALAGMDVTLLHLNTAGITASIPPTEKPINLLSGGSTVGLIALSLAHVLGYRVFHLYGMDSSYRDAEHHAYAQGLNAGESVLEAEAGGRIFSAAPWMLRQVAEFQELASLLASEGCTLTVAGDGLLPHVARLMAAGYARQPEAA